MAITLADAVVNIGANLDPLQKGFDQAQGRLSSFGANATRLLGGALVGATAAAAAGVAAIGAAAFDVSGQVNEVTRNLQGDLGVTEEKARQLGEVARDVFRNNFADSVRDAGDAVGVVQQQLGNLVDESDLQSITEDAFRMRDAFDVDVGESISSVRSLMENFGLDADRAFDLVAAGFQRGLNRSGDFLDTVQEYSVQFAEGGASAEEFFGLLNSGLEGGVLGTDKAADAFKEFRVRIVDDSDTTKDALEQLGLSYDDIAEGMADGTITAADAFDQVIRKLQETENPVDRFQAGVGLLGTQYEDLGDAIATGLDLTEDWAEGTEGAIDSVDQRYNSFRDVAQGVWRDVVVAASPVTDKLLEMANEVMPAVSDFIKNTLGPTFEGWAENAVEWLSGQNGLIEAIKEAGATATWQPLMDWLRDTNQSVEDITRAIDGIRAAWDRVKGIADWVNNNIVDPGLRAENAYRRLIGAPEIDLERWGVGQSPANTNVTPVMATDPSIGAFRPSPHSLWMGAPQDINVSVNVTGADPGNGARIGAQTGVEQAMSSQGITP